jgi:hypothetical protein
VWRAWGQHLRTGRGRPRSDVGDWGDTSWSGHPIRRCGHVSTARIGCRSSAVTLRRFDDLTHQPFRRSRHVGTTSVGCRSSAVTLRRLERTRLWRRVGCEICRSNDHGSGRARPSEGCAHLSSDGRCVDVRLTVLVTGLALLRSRDIWQSASFSLRDNWHPVHQQTVVPELGLKTAPGHFVHDVPNGTGVHLGGEDGWERPEEVLRGRGIPRDHLDVVCRDWHRGRREERRAADGGGGCAAFAAQERGFWGRRRDGGDLGDGRINSRGEDSEGESGQHDQAEHEEVEGFQAVCPDGGHRHG